MPPAPGAVGPVLLEAYDLSRDAGRMDPRHPWEMLPSGPIDGVVARADFPGLFPETDEGSGACTDDDTGLRRDAGIGSGKAPRTTDGPGLRSPVVTRSR